MKHFATIAAVLNVSAACIAVTPANAQSSPGMRNGLRGASATVSATTLRVVFPAVPVDSLGCSRTESLPTLGEVRYYYFLVTNHFPSSRYPDNHLMQTGVSAWLPPAAMPTRARIDSVFRAAAISVDEAAGEPPMTVRRTRPTRATARYVRGHVVLEVVGDSAIRAFLAAGRDSVSLGWCERSEPMSFVHVPLRAVRD